MHGERAKAITRFTYIHHHYLYCQNLAVRHQQRETPPDCPTARLPPPPLPSAHPGLATIAGTETEELWRLTRLYGWKRLPILGAATGPSSLRRWRTPETCPTADTPATSPRDRVKDSLFPVARLAYVTGPLPFTDQSQPVPGSVPGRIVLFSAETGQHRSAHASSRQRTPRRSRAAAPPRRR